MPSFEKILKRDYGAVFLLLSIAAVIRFPFVLDGFGDVDSSGLAVSIIDFTRHGKDGFLTNLYFLDVVPLYVLSIKIIMKLLDYNYAYLITVMNYTNALFGTLIIIPAYFFTERLFMKKSIAFYTALTFTFAPSIYQASIFGFPSLLGLFFFLTSLYFFLVWLDDGKHTSLIISFIALTVTILLKSDFILGCGAYLGLLYMRRIKEKEKIASGVLIIILAFASFLLLRQWIIGTQRGYTSSSAGFLAWFIHFFHPLFSKGISDLLENQVDPIVYGIGIPSFFMAGAAFVFFLMKRKWDIVVFVLTWTALPTALWLVLWNNNARHNMLSVLPYIVIIFLFIHEKAPRLIALFPVILIVGNFLITAPSASTRIPSGNLFKSQKALNSQVSNIHMAAARIADLKNNKIIFTTESFRPYLYYEVFSLEPNYTLMKIESSCYVINNKRAKCILCTFENTDPASFIRHMITKYHIEDYTIVSPFLNLEVFKKQGFNTVDINDVESWVSYKGAIPLLELPARGGE